MKSLQKVTRVKLKISNADEFILLGIVSAEPDYKLSNILNRKFKISLKNITPVIIPDKDGKELLFSRFSDSDSFPDTVFSLISNRSGNNYLLKKLKNVDYVLQVHDPDNNNNINNLTSGLKEIDSVTAIFSFDLNSIKDKNLQYLIH